MYIKSVKATMFIKALANPIKNCTVSKSKICFDSETFIFNTLKILFFITLNIQIRVFPNFLLKTGNAVTVTF